LLLQLNIVLVDRLNVIHSLQEKKKTKYEIFQKIKFFFFSFTLIGSVVDDDIVFKLKK
jgi:hypothetical protein